METILAWSVENVCEWVRDKLELEQYCDAFRSGAVDGALLVEMRDDELLADLDIQNRLHRKKILTRIKQMLGR